MNEKSARKLQLSRRPKWSTEPDRSAPRTDGARGVLCRNGCGADHAERGNLAPLAFL